MSSDRLTEKFKQDLDKLLIDFLLRFQAIFNEHLVPQGRDFTAFLNHIVQCRTKLRERLQRTRILRLRAYICGIYTTTSLTGLRDLYTLTLVNFDTVLDAFLGELDINISQQDINAASDQAHHDLSQIRNLLFLNLDDLIEEVRKIARNTSV